MVVYVLNKDGQALMPTSRFSKVRRLLNSKEAFIVKDCPFTIQLKYETSNCIQYITLGVDTGTKFIGLSASSQDKELFSAEVQLRDDIPKLLLDRRSRRSFRRSRKTRYRKPRFNNRVGSKKKGWLAPSVKNKVNSHINIINKIHSILPINKIIVEVAAFDTQKMVKPEINGVKYQQGTLYGYEIREYLLEKFNRKCAYCGAKNIPLEIEHIVPKSRGGSNQVSNLTLACHSCNQKKGSMTAEEFGYKKIKSKADSSLKYSAYMNICRWSIYNKLKALYGDKVSLTYGYKTKHDRIKLGLDKSHYNDAFVITANLKAKPLSTTFIIKKIRCHNRRLHKDTILKGGKRKNNQLPFIMYGYRLFDKVKFNNKDYFVLSRRSSGSFKIGSLIDKDDKVDGINYKKLELRGLRRNLLIERMVKPISSPSKTKV